MKHNKPIQLKHILLFMLIITSVSVINLLLFPSFRKGPLGFGQPAKMTTFNAFDGSYSISHPANWTAFNTPQGNHGDTEVIAIITVSGHQMANLTISRQNLPDQTLDEVINWGQSRAEKHSGFTPVELIEISNINYDVYSFNYYWSSTNVWKKELLIYCQDFYILNQNTGYSLAYCSKEKDWPELFNYYADVQNSFVFMHN